MLTIWDGKRGLPIGMLPNWFWVSAPESVKPRRSIENDGRF